MMNIYNFSEFINEAKSEKMIYFFHPKFVTDTRAEDRSIELINLYFDNPIIYNSPSMRGGYYEYVDSINTIVVLPNSDGSISPKTMRRISYSFDRGIDVYYIHPKRYKIIKIENVEFFQEKELSAEEYQQRIAEDNLDNYFTDTE